MQTHHPILVIRSSRRATCNSVATIAAIASSPDFRKIVALKPPITPPLHCILTISPRQAGGSIKIYSHYTSGRARITKRGCRCRRPRYESRLIERETAADWFKIRSLRMHLVRSPASASRAPGDRALK